MGVDPAAHIHPSALVEPGAVIGPGAEIGTFAVIGPDVTLGARVRVKAHAIVTGLTAIGADTVIFPFANVGDEPQDLKYRGERTRLNVGARNRIREGVTLNTGTEGGGGITRIGDDCLFMTGAHVGHDCQVGSRVIMANNTALGGHCLIGDDVVIGGLAGVHQFVRVGEGAIVGAMTKITRDVLPYALVDEARGELAGINLVGLKRRGVARDEIMALKAAFDVLAGDEGTFAERARRVAESQEGDLAQAVAAFILEGSERSFLTPPRRG